MKKAVISVLYFILMILFIGCVIPENRPSENAPNPISLTSDDMDIYGQIGRDSNDFYRPISLDISKIGTYDWMVIVDRYNKNIIRFKLNDENEPLVENTNEHFYGVITDYEIDGVPQKVSSDSNGNTYIISQLVNDDNVLKVRLLKYELEGTTETPKKQATWNFNIYPDYDSDEKIKYDGPDEDTDLEEYSTTFSHITKLALIENSGNPKAFVSANSSYTFTLSKVKRTVPPTGVFGSDGTTPIDTYQWNVRKLNNVDLASGNPPTSITDIWLSPFTYFGYIDGTGVDAAIGAPLNDTIVDVYTMKNANLNSENIYILFIDNYVVEENRIDVDGVVKPMKVGKGIVKIKSYNASTGTETVYTFIGNNSIINPDTDEPYISEVELSSPSDVNNSNYQFYLNGWLSDANAIALDSTGNNLFVLKYNQAYVMWFTKDGDNFKFKASIDVTIDSIGELMKRPMDIEFYDDGTDKFLFILDTDNARLIRIKITSSFS